MSLMSGKSFATGEAGMVVTDDREIYERSIAYGHYERYTLANIETEDLKPYVGLPLGGQTAHASAELGDGTRSSKLR